jgi:hypothetical protein
MGVSSVKSAAFIRNHDIEVDLAKAILRTEQLLQQPPAGAVSSAAATLGKWIPVTPDIASDVITRSAAQNTDRFRSVNL